MFDSWNNRNQKSQTLRFSARAWVGWHMLCALATTEIACFFIADPDDPLHLVDFYVPRQEASMGHYKLAEDAILDMRDWCDEKGIKFRQLYSYSAHTHPGSSPHPSGTDEENYAKVHKNMPYAFMMILAREGGQIYTRLEGVIDGKKRYNERWYLEIDWEDERPLVSREEILATIKEKVEVFDLKAEQEKWKKEREDWTKEDREWLENEKAKHASYKPESATDKPVPIGRAINLLQDGKGKLTVRVPQSAIQEIAIGLMNHSPRAHVAYKRLMMDDQARVDEILLMQG